MHWCVRTYLPKCTKMQDIGDIRGIKGVKKTRYETSKTFIPNITTAREGMDLWVNVFRKCLDGLFSSAAAAALVVVVAVVSSLVAGF